MNRMLIVFFLLLFAQSSLVFSQSDYRITQEFKSRQRSFEVAIEYAKSYEEIERIKKEITEFRNEFRGNKDLLNRALYPNNFESSFASLDKKIEFANKKIEEISELQTRVVDLETNYNLISDELASLTREVTTLRSTNSRLMNELKAFRTGYSGSKEEIDSLNNIISQLRLGINQRDTLIQEIMQNIFANAEHRIQSLDDAELKGITAKIQNTSLIDNIKNLVRDNIDFLNASLLTKEDLGVLRDEYDDFTDRWSHFGPKLFDIYSNDKENKEKLSEIDSLITDWEYSLNASVWKTVDELFNEHNIKLDPYETGEEFEEAVISYIDRAIENNQTEIHKDQNYLYFAEKVWNSGMKSEWLPILKSNNLITDEQIDNIEKKLAEWKENSSGVTSYFIYGIIVLLAIIIVVSLYLLSKKNKKQKESIVSKEEESGKLKTDFNSDSFIDDKKE